VLGFEEVKIMQAIGKKQVLFRLCIFCSGPRSCKIDMKHCLQKICNALRFNLTNMSLWKASKRIHHQIGKKSIFINNFDGTENQLLAH